MIDWWEALVPWQQTVAVVGAGIALHVLVRCVLLRGLSRIAKATENDLDDRLLQFFRRFYALLLVFVVILAILKINGIKVTPMLASAGIAGIAIGLAAKETLADILAGVFLIVDRPMRIGDRIKIDRIGNHWGSWGDVVDIRMRRTLIRNTDGVIVNYPNNVLANSIITNFSFEDQPVRVRVRFQVDYEADLERVIELARTAIEAAEGTIADTADVVVRSLWDDERGHSLSGVLVEGRYRIENVRERTRIRSRVLQQIANTLAIEGIGFAKARVALESRPGELGA